MSGTNNFKSLIKSIGQFGLSTAIRKFISEKKRKTKN
jgi:hypothetical protein